MQRGHLGAATGFAEDRHVRRITAERRDVVAHPLERRYEVEHPRVPRRREFGPRNLREVQIPEDAQSVIQRHDDNIAASRQRRTIVDRPRTGAETVSAAVHPDHHRPPRTRSAWRPDVEIQAILRQRRLLRPAVRTSGKLWTRRAVLERRSHAGPLRYRRRRPKAQLTDRWRSIRDAPEHEDILVVASEHLSRRCLDDWFLHASLLFELLLPITVRPRP